MLPALDATTMGWADRDWYLGPYRPILFDSNGNGGPTIWVDGRIVGGWVQRASGEIVPNLLEDVGAEARAAIDREVARLAEWVGPVNIRSSFPSPLETGREGGYARSSRHPRWIEDLREDRLRVRPVGRTDDARR